MDWPIRTGKISERSERRVGSQSPRSGFEEPLLTSFFSVVVFGCQSHCRACGPHTCKLMFLRKNWVGRLEASTLFVFNIGARPESRAGEPHRSH